MTSWLLVLVLFAMLGYMLTVSGIEYLHITGLIVFCFCLITFVACLILYMVFTNKENKDE